MTIVLTRSDIDRTIDVPAALALLEDGFRAAQQAPVPPLRVRTGLPGPGTATCLLPGLLPPIPAYTVKVNAKFPEATPALRGVVCLHDLNTGELLALLDSAAATAWRTGLAAALATDLLARPDCATLAVIGAGEQARKVLAGLHHLRRDKLRGLVVTDLETTRAHRFAREQAELLNIPIEVISDPSLAAAASDIVVLATWASQPLLDKHDARAGQHITTLGADEPGKVELAADLLLASRVIVDDVELSLSMGAIANAGLDATAVAGTLTDVLLHLLPGRTCSDEVTVYAPVGLPWQDLALCWLLYEAALGTGDSRTVELLK